MATNGGAVDALERELIKIGRRKKKPAPVKRSPMERQIAKYEKLLRK